MSLIITNSLKLTQRVSQVIRPSVIRSTSCSLQTPISSITRHISSCPPLLTYQFRDRDYYPEPKRWPLKNRLIFPPQSQEEEPRERYFCHHRANIKYSPKKMWFICSLIRGMGIDEAIKQLSFVMRKGAYVLKDVLEEAREIAMKEHNFEFKSNMWVGDCFCTKGYVVKGARKHARMRFGEIRYFHIHVYVRLVEGQPPKDYWGKYASGHDKLMEYVNDLRNRKIIHGL